MFIPHFDTHCHYIENVCLPHFRFSSYLCQQN